MASKTRRKTKTQRKQNKTESRKKKQTKTESRKKKQNKTQKYLHKQYNQSKLRKNSLDLLKHDYYTYVNLTWLKKTKLPNKYNIIDEFSTLQRKIDKKIEKNIVPILLKDKNIRNLYNSIYTFNNEFVNSQLYLLMNVLNEHRKSTNIDALSIFLAWLINNDFNSPINFYTTNDLKNNKYKIAYITEGGTTFPKDFYLSNSSASSNDREKYKSYLKDLFASFFGKNHMYNTDDILSIEKEISSHFKELKDKTIESEYNKISLHDAKEGLGFDWLKIRSTIFEYSDIDYTSSRSPTHIIIKNPHFVKHVMRLLKHNWTSNKWNTFWIYKVLNIIANFNRELYIIKSNFFIKEMNNIKISINDKLRASQTIISACNHEVSKQYIKDYKNVNEIALCRHLITLIHNKFRAILEKNTWLSPKTIKRAILKLYKMEFIIGSADKFEKENDIHYHPDNGMLNYLKKSKYENIKYLKKEGQPGLSKNVWVDEYLSIFKVNALYDNTRNTILFPNAILQPPFIDVNKDFIYNIANIGVIISHEMFHGFDSDGCKFDETGNYNKWWLPEDEKEYKKKQDDVIQQYEKAGKHDNIQLEGKTTLAENIADIGGLYIIECILEDYLIKHGLQIDESFDNFYYYYTHRYKTVLKKKMFHTLIKYDSHSLFKYRINCVLSRSKRFQSIYNIKQGDGMYYANTDQIW
jgi:predicted metalloendopeptidase